MLSKYRNPILSSAQNNIEYMRVMDLTTKVFNGIRYFDPTGALDGLMTYKNKKEHPLMIFGPGVQ